MMQVDDACSCVPQPLQVSSRRSRTAIFGPAAARLRDVLFAWCTAAFIPFGQPSGVRAATLYEQSLAVALEQRFPQQNLSYILVGAPTGERVAGHWANPDRPLPLGSLLKPFTALAYGESHSFVYPIYTCRGIADGCWLSRGHGRIGIEDAIAHSCNLYFSKLAMDVRSMDVAAVASEFRLGIPAEFGGTTLVGLGSGWAVSPASIVRAYCKLAEADHIPGADEILRGMALSATTGTGQAVGLALGSTGISALTKTGTAPCTHGQRGTGDGFTLALWPAASPRYALLVRVHGVPGAEAAVVCAKMLRTALEPLRWNEK